MFLFIKFSFINLFFCLIHFIDTPATSFCHVRTEKGKIQEKNSCNFQVLLHKWVEYNFHSQ